MSALTVFEIPQGSTRDYAIAFDMPAGDLSLATEIELAFTLDNDLSAAPALVLSLTGGEIVITGTLSATATLDAATSATLALGRYVWRTWLTLTTGERYNTQKGIALVTLPGAP